MTSPTSGNRNKLNLELKKRKCEIIPEEDEDRLKTEYRSSRKFFDLKNYNNKESVNSMHSLHSMSVMNSINSMNSINQNGINNLKKESDNKEELNIFIRESTEENEDETYKGIF